MSKIIALRLKNQLKNQLQIINTMDVLKQIAISEYQFMDKGRQEASRFISVLEPFFHFYARASNIRQSIFFNNSCRIPALVVVGSDEGFLGLLNNQIIHQAAEFYRKHPDTHVVVIGRRAARKLVDKGVTVHHELPGIAVPLNYSEVLPLKNYLMGQYLRQRIGSAEVVYARCLSFSRQTMRIKKLLPFDALLNAGDMNLRVEEVEEKQYVIFEPDLVGIIEFTISMWFGRKLYEIFWDAKLSEVAGRAIELNERYEDLSRTRNKTRTRYFRACHEVIDEGIREIFASQHFARKLKRVGARHAVPASGHPRNL